MREKRVALLIRIPKELKEKLAELAKRDRRSVNQQIEFMLYQAVGTELSSVARKARPKATPASGA
jgi:hypothetical protein